MSLRIVRRVVLIACAMHATAATAWEPDAAQMQQLAARETVVVADVDPSGASGRARAAVLIAARPETVYGWMTDCARALTFVPNLVACKVLETAVDRSTATIAHEINYAWFLPRTRYVFLARYQPPVRVEFKEVSGDLEINQGSWQLRADKVGTLLTYEVRIRPKAFVPQWLVRRSLRKDLPELLLALRRVSEAGDEKP